MKITFLGHSGYAVEISGLLLVFDYETGCLPLDSDPAEAVFFVSHQHQDHFNPQIFSMEPLAGRAAYVLSRDTRRKVRKIGGPEERIHYMTAGEEVCLDAGDQTLRIRTLCSTDCGVAFLVGCGEYQIYHGGDLNCWSWPGDSKQHRNQMVAEYRREIQKLKGEKIHVAFCPLDPRLEEWYAEGFRYFLEHVDADYVWPMHMWKEFGTVGRFLDSLEDEKQKGRVVSVSHDGQQWDCGRVAEIEEPDFGCEGRPDGEAAQDRLLVRMEDGSTRVRWEADSSLYDRGVDEGSLLTWEV